jgi:hypothetical protein
MTSSGIEPPIFRLVVLCLNYATAWPLFRWCTVCFLSVRAVITPSKLGALPVYMKNFMHNSRNVFGMLAPLTSIQVDAY